MSQTTLVWFRRDLRIFDNAALQLAASGGLPLAGIFVREQEPDCAGAARRSLFVWQSLSELHAALARKGIPLFVLEGPAQEAVPAFAREADAARVVCAEAYAPQEVARDMAVAARLAGEGRHFDMAQDALLLPKSQLADEAGNPFSGFEAYRAAWLDVVARCDWAANENEDWGRRQQSLPEKLKPLPPMMPAQAFGAQRQAWVIEGGEHAGAALLQDFMKRIDTYHLTRGLPGSATSQLSPHFCFGTVSLRQAVRLAKARGGKGAQAWLAALARREFYYQWFYHRPQALHGGTDEQAESEDACLKAWRQGQTGYPLADAAMRCLNRTGYLPDSLRAYAARFFTQILGGSWQQGAAYFARQLLDWDVMLNNGNWQSAAQTGIPFNPLAAAQSLDPGGRTVRRYVHELAHLPKDIIHTPWLAKGSINTNGYPDPAVLFDSV